MFSAIGLAAFGLVISSLVGIAAGLVGYLGYRAQKKTRLDQERSKVAESAVDGSEISLEWMKASLNRSDIDRIRQEERYNQMEQRYMADLSHLRAQMNDLAARSAIQMEELAAKAASDNAICEERVRILTIKVNKLDGAA